MQEFLLPAFFAFFRSSIFIFLTVSFTSMPDLLAASAVAFFLFCMYLSSSLFKCFYRIFSAWKSTSTFISCNMQPVYIAFWKECIVISFLIRYSNSWISCFLQPRKGTEYLTTGTTHVLITLIMLFPFNFVSNTFVTLCLYYLLISFYLWCLYIN